METVSGEAGAKQHYCPVFSGLLFGKISCIRVASCPMLKFFLQVGVRELKMTNEKENVCLALFFFDNLSSNRAKVIWSPHNAQGFQGDSWKQTCIKTTCSLRWKPCLLAVCFKSSHSSGCISLTANSGGFCLKGGCLSGWLIKQLEIFPAEFLCYVLTKPVEHCYTNRSPWEHA